MTRLSNQTKLDEVSSSQVQPYFQHTARLAGIQMIWRI